MSAESLPQSESNQSAPTRKERYSRAQQRELQKAETALNRQRDSERANRYAVQAQAIQDRADAARRVQQQAGRSGEIDQVTALLNGGELPDGGRVEAGKHEQALRANAHDTAGGGGSPSHASLPADDFPDEDDDGGSRDESRPKTLADYAAERELDVSELYGLTVTTDDGESYSLEQLKDGAKKLHDLDDREADFEDQREAHYNEIAIKQQNIEALLNRLKAYVPPEVLARAAVEAEGDPEEMRQKSIRQLREWFPEWRDNQVQQRDRERVETRLMAYGFSKFEVSAIADARIIRFLVETARKLERYDRLRAMPRDKIPTTAGPSNRAKPISRSSIEDRAKQQAAKGDKIGAIATLLGG